MIQDQENNNQASENQEAKTKMSPSQMKAWFKSQLDMMRPRTELMELEARYVKAKAEFNHFSGLLAEQEVKPEQKPEIDKKLDGDAEVSKAKDLAEVNGELSAGS